MSVYKNDICTSCENGPFEKCGATWEQIMLDDVTRCVVDCDIYTEKPKHHVKITYECDGKIAVEEKDVYDLPKLKWKKAAAAGYGEFDNVMLSDDEFGKLQRDYPNEYEDYIQSLSEYLVYNPLKAKKYKNHYAVIKSWIRKDRKKRAEREKESREREARRSNRDKLSGAASYDIEKIKQKALMNDEID